MVKVVHVYKSLLTCVCTVVGGAWYHGFIMKKTHRATSGGKMGKRGPLPMPFMKSAGDAEEKGMMKTAKKAVVKK